MQAGSSSQREREREWKRQSVSQGVLTLNGKVLLVSNDYGAKGLLWSLPGGRLEPGEQHVTAMVREFKEETGLDVIANDLIYVADAKTEIDRYHFVTCVFAVTLAPHISLEGNGEPYISCEGDLAVRQVLFVPFEQVPHYIERPSLGEPLINYLYYGRDKMPRRYWFYPEYNSAIFVPICWPPVPLE